MIVNTDQAVVVSYAQSQHADGRDEMALKVKESLAHMRFMEEGYGWKDARDMARALIQENYRGA